MRVGLALHYIRRDRITGVERYGLSLAGSLCRLAGDLQMEILATAAAAERLPKCSDALTTLPGDWRLAGEQFVLPLWERLRHLDLLHLPAFGGAVVRGKPFVLTLHDTVFWDAPEQLSTLGAWYYRPLVERALRSRRLRATIFVSSAARDAAIRRFPHLAGTAHVCYNAIPLAAATGPRRRSDRPDGPIRIFSVGTIEPRKNLPGMARAVRRLAECVRRPVKWQLAGRKGWAGAAEHEALEIPEAEWVGPVSDDRLIELYRAADVFLTLSHLEGFNIPLAEALSQGTPAVASALPVHEEVAGTAALFVNGGDPDAAAEAMRRLILDDELWEQRSADGWRRGRDFTDEALARRTLDVYRAAGR